jgi:hypothetical protein
MNRTRATRWISVVSAAATLPVLAVSVPASAAQTVRIVADTSFIDPVSPFTSDIDGCETGTVENGRFSNPPSRGLGTFAGLKEFSCLDESDDVVGTFTVQLAAHFPVGPGSAGRWTVIDSSGSVEGLHASGSVIGYGAEFGILDVYDGTIRAAR